MATCFILTAIDVYAHRIRKYVGSCTAVLGRVDALVFTAGVGENSADIRERICDGLEGLGIRIDPARNRAATRGVRAIHADEGAVRLLVVPTNEELEIAEQTLRCIQGGRRHATLIEIHDRTNREGAHPMTEATAGPFAGLLVFDFSMYMSAFQVRGSTP